MRGRVALRLSLLVALAVLLCSGPAGAQGPSLTGQAVLGSGFTYQGRLLDGGVPVSGSYDLQFKLFDAATGGTEKGTLDIPDWAVANGLFTVPLDFGSAPFNGQALWLQAGVRPGPSGDPYETLSPRTPISAAPYALFAANTAGSPFANVVVVAKSGGDFTTIQAALDSITTAGAGNPYLVWVAPGTYAEQVTMKPYVDIEGAGRWLTTITHTGSAGPDQGTVIAAANTELRSLKVENTGAGGADAAVAIYSESGPYRVTNVIASATGGSLNYGVLSLGAGALLTDVTIAASGGNANVGVASITNAPLVLNNSAVSVSGGIGTNVGLAHDASSAIINNSAVLATGPVGSANYGIVNSTSSGIYTVVVHNSGIGGTSASVRNGGGFNTRIAATQLTGGNVFISPGGTVTCAGVYDKNYLFYSAICP